MCSSLPPGASGKHMELQNKKRSKSSSQTYTWANQEQIEQTEQIEQNFNLIKDIYKNPTVSIIHHSKRLHFFYDQEQIKDVYYYFYSACIGASIQVYQVCKNNSNT